jgi:hypothetical protein
MQEFTSISPTAALIAAAVHAIEIHQLHRRIRFFLSLSDRVGDGGDAEYSASSESMAQLVND